MTRRTVAAAVLALAAGCASGGGGASPAQAPAAATPAASGTASAAPQRDYLFYVASEGNDRVALVRFGPCRGAAPAAGAAGCTKVEREFRMGFNPTEPVGPHGIGLTPDGRHYYVSTAHGFPNGALWKYTTGNDSLVGRVTLGAFPATLQVSPDGIYVWVVNFNLHGDMVPSSVSVVYGEQMVEVARVRTCTMPHGSRLSPDGRRHYSACMMDDMLVEIDAEQMGVARHFMLKKGSEHGMAGAPRQHAGAHGGGDHGGHGTANPPANAVECSPTWAQPSTDGARVWVACNRSNELVEVDVARWALVRRLPAGNGIYNLATTPDGRLLVATNKRGQTVSIFDATSGRELAAVRTSRRLPSGVAVSTDGRYAFATLEGVGSEPGTVDVIDLRTFTRVASVDLGQQAGGVDFWRIE